MFDPLVVIIINVFFNGGFELHTALIKDREYSKDSDFYNKVDITKQTWSNIMPNCKTPSINTLLKIVFAFRCNTHEYKYVLEKAGLTLASHSDYNLITRYCIENNICDFCDVNVLLKENGYKKLE